MEQYARLCSSQSTERPQKRTQSRLQVMPMHGNSKYRYLLSGDGRSGEAFGPGMWKLNLLNNNIFIQTFTFHNVQTSDLCQFTNMLHVLHVGLLFLFRRNVQQVHH